MAADTTVETRRYEENPAKAPTAMVFLARGRQDQRFLKFGSVVSALVIVCGHAGPRGTLKWDEYDGAPVGERLSPSSPW